jgi:hypothetical protein
MWRTPKHLEIEDPAAVDGGHNNDRVLGNLQGAVSGTQGGVGVSWATPDGRRVSGW